MPLIIDLLSCFCQPLKRTIATGKREERSSLRDSTRTEAGSTHTNPHAAAVDNGPDSLQIHIPPPPVDVMGVADFIAKSRPFAADLT